MDRRLVMPCTRTRLHMFVQSFVPSSFIGSSIQACGKRHLVCSSVSSVAGLGNGCIQPLAVVVVEVLKVPAWQSVSEFVCCNHLKLVSFFRKMNSDDQCECQPACLFWLTDSVSVATTGIIALTIISHICCKQLMLNVSCGCCYYQCFRCFGAPQSSGLTIFHTKDPCSLLITLRAFEWCLLFCLNCLFVRLSLDPHPFILLRIVL